MVRPVIRRAAHFGFAFVAASAVTQALGLVALGVEPGRLVAPESYIAAALLAGVVGAGLSLVFSPAHRRLRLVLDVVVAAPVWVVYGAAVWVLVGAALERALGWGLLFALVELLALWLLLGAGLILLMCVPWIRRERAGTVAISFTVRRSAAAVALACAPLLALRVLVLLAEEPPAGAAGVAASSATTAAEEGAHSSEFTVRLSAHVRFLENGANQTIASRPLDQGQQQFPWLFRVDPHGKLQVGINLVGSDLSYCAAPTPLAAGDHDVGFVFDGRVISIMADGAELAHCQVLGALRTSGEVLWGHLRHFRSPDDRQAFGGELSSTFVLEAERR